MKPENKELLLKDLCARLPYGVKAYHGGSSNKGVDTVGGYYTYISNQFYLNESEYWVDVEQLKPYLRPMSSMTEEEKEYLNQMFRYYGEYTSNCEVPDISDFYNSHYFDYRGLIKKGLALEAPEEMYKIK